MSNTIAGIVAGLIILIAISLGTVIGQSMQLSDEAIQDHIERRYQANHRSPEPTSCTPNE